MKDINRPTAAERHDEFETDMAIEYRFRYERHPEKTVDGDYPAHPDDPGQGFTNDGDHDVFDPWGWQD